MPTFNIPKAPTVLMFYRVTRPQAPAYHREEPRLRDKVECSICRGLFLPDRELEKAAHRGWHEANGNAIIPAQEAELHNGEWVLTHKCHDCGEDVLRAPDHLALHNHECERWQQVNDLIDMENEADADTLADEILNSRPAWAA